MGRLEGKVAVVTGAADGIGHAIAEGFAREGADVFLSGINDKGGGLDVLVNNAAIAIGAMPVYEMTDEQWHRLIAVNLTSVFRGCKYALPHMIREKRGSIINMASAQGHVGLDGWTAYAGAKGAVMAMTRQMAVEFGPHNVRVNSISPGTINTPMNEKVVADVGGQVARAWVKMHPVGRTRAPA